MELLAANDDFRFSVVGAFGYHHLSPVLLAF
jgi:hypothetical protein